MPSSASLAYLAYRAASVLHWQPREQAISRVLDSLRLNRAPAGRVLDVGCGLGQLSRVARARGFAYLGLEPDERLLAHCRRTYPELDGGFVRGTAGDASGLLGPSDIVVLNGVAHHLGDDELWPLLQAARSSRALVIADHWRRPGQMSAITRWLQARDRGKDVRDYDVFENLPGFGLVSSDVFFIGPLRLRLWVYFCNHYRPSPAPASSDHGPQHL